MKVGDLATLKTGEGPWMVLDTIRSDPDGNQFYCTWYDSRSAKFKIEPFGESALKFKDFDDDTKFEPGMVVDLRCGDAPSLVIESIYKGNNGVYSAVCVWWNKNTQEHIREDFNLHVLLLEAI